MKQRKSFIEKVKQVYVQHKNVIQIIFAVIIGIAFFASGFLISSSLLEKPLISNNEFEFYEQVARDVYNQGNKTIYEVPDGVSLKKTDTSITVSSAKVSVRGKVVATLQNGELVCVYDAETVEAILINSLIGILFVFVWVIIVAFIHEKKKKRE